MRAWACGCRACVGIVRRPRRSRSKQQQRDPFNGQFGVLEIAPLPGDAARLAKLMGDALGGLQPQRPGVQDVYLLSVASGAIRCSSAKPRKPKMRAPSRCIHGDEWFVDVVVGLACCWCGVVRCCC